MTVPINYAANEVKYVDVLIEDLELSGPWTAEKFATLYENLTSRYDSYRDYIDGRKIRSTPYVEKVGEVLRLRQTTDLSQAEIGRRVGIPARTVSGIVNRKKVE